MVTLRDNHTKELTKIGQNPPHTFPNSPVIQHPANIWLQTANNLTHNQNARPILK